MLAFQLDAVVAADVLNNQLSNQNVNANAHQNLAHLSVNAKDAHLSLRVDVAVAVTDVSIV